MQSLLGKRLTVALGVLLIGFGVAEVVTHRDDTAAAQLFWALSLLGGGTVVLLGAYVWPRASGAGAALVLVGTMAGLLATAWTIVVPVLGLLVVFLAIRDAAAAGGSGGQPPKASV